MKLCDPKQHGQGTYPKSQSADGSQFRNSSPLRTWRWKEEAMVKRCLLACSSRPAQPTFIAEPRTTCPGAAPSGLCPSASLTDHSQACHLLEDFFFFQLRLLLSDDFSLCEVDIKLSSTPDKCSSTEPHLYPGFSFRT